MSRLLLALLLVTFGAGALAALPARVNPHHGNPLEPAATCSACHTEVPATGSAPSDAHLRLAPAAVCATCHPGMPHQGAAEHLGQPLPAGVSWPSADGQITCFTCHDVHDDTTGGKLTSRLAKRLGDRAAERSWAGRLEGVTKPGEGAGRPPMLRAPLAGGALCRTCHGAGP